MLTKLTQPEVVEFIKDNLSKTPSNVALLASKYRNLPIKEICNQIECRQKAKIKLPSWSANFNIVFPPKISWEQCSSEQTANYKANILKGQTLLDLTGGFGIDSYYLSKSYKQIIHIEQNEQLQKIAEHNFKKLAANNIKSIPTNSIEYLKSTTQHFDSIYIDPARRDANNKRVSSLTDCTPNVIKQLSLLLEKCNKLIIKTAPLLDIKNTLKELNYVYEVHVISVKNDCKEVLYVLSKINGNNPKINCVNLGNNQPNFTFNYPEENNILSNFSDPKKYLYEPNSSILKAGAFKKIAENFNLHKLHPNTHLYTSEKLINFPGKRFEIISICNYNQKEIATFLPTKKANIATRNFKQKPEEVSKKLKLKNGGTTMLFACTLNSNKLAIIVTKPIL